MPKPSLTAFIFTLSLLITALSSPAAGDEQKPPEKKGPPPAVGAVEEAVRGLAEPMNEFIGTVFYSHVSDIASEVAGKVAGVGYDEGEKIRKGQVLVRLDNEILQTRVEATRASHEQALIELELAGKDLARMEALFRAESISESLYDENVFKVRRLEKRAGELAASLRNHELQFEKTSIRAGFGGIAVERTVEPGEWVNTGGTVAVVANNSEVDVVIDVPAETLEHIERGRKVEVTTRGKTLTGTFTGFIPKGDVATRTFSVKVRFRNTANLIEGMEARALLPVGPKFEGVLISRDAVINKFGQDVVFAVFDGAAKMIPVKVLGYEGMKASISGEGLEPGMMIVVKGNERIRDGQPVRVTPGPAK